MCRQFRVHHDLANAQFGRNLGSPLGVAAGLVLPVAGRRGTFLRVETTDARRLLPPQHDAAARSNLSGT
jgi:hypothetical protein